MLGVSVQQAQYHLGLHLRKNIIRLRFPSKMVKLANLFFLLFSTVSPKPLSLNNNNNSSMDVEANPNISPMVLFKSDTLPTKTTSFSTIKPLPVFAAGMGAAMPLDMKVANGIVKGLRAVYMEANPTLVLILATSFLFLGLLLPLLLLVLLLQYVLPKDLAGCVNQCGLPIQCNANYSKRAAYEEI